MTIGETLFPTTIAGSLPKPAWLAAPQKLWAPWRLEGEELASAKDDATLLAHALMQKFSRQQGRARLRFKPEALDAIEKHTWPGNVREMENLIKRAVIMAEGSQIGVDDLGLPRAGGEPEPMNLRQVREQAERDVIVRVLSRVDGNIVSAAELLGVSRPTLYDLLSRHGLKASASGKGEDEPQERENPT